MLNEVLGVAARYNQLLTRKYGITGGAPSPQITPEIAPVMVMPDGPEQLILAGEFLAAGVLEIPGVALKKSTAMLFNPTRSNQLVIVEQISCYGNSAGNRVCGSVNSIGALAQLPSPGGVTIRDTRVRTNGGAYTREPSASLSYDQSPPMFGVPNVFLEALATLAVLNRQIPIVLGPGYGLQIWLDVVAAFLNVTYVWREVPLAAGEGGPF